MSAKNAGRTRVLAPCKINPTLSVIERRGDGFHELDLTFLALDLCDVSSLESIRPRQSELRIEGPMFTEDIPCDARNLAWRAAQGVLDIARREGLAAEQDGFELALTKEIPSRAGLGGGSSDGAAAALGICTATGLAPSDPRVPALLAELGSDPAFFFAARETGHARGRGRGEQIEVLPRLKSPLWVTLTSPLLGARTELVYRALESLGEAGSNRSRGQDRFAAWSSASSIEDRRAALCNDLEKPALRAFPELARWRALLDQSALGHHRLAGSGSSFFGLYADEAQARADQATLLRAAREQGLKLRGTWVARALGHAARVMD